MRLSAVECCVCNRTVVADDANLFRIGYNPLDPLKSSGHTGFTSVAEWHSGVRAVCKWCLMAFPKLLEDTSNVT